MEQAGPGPGVVRGFRSCVKELRVVVWRSDDGKIHRKLPTFPNLYARAPVISPHSILLSPAGKYLATTWEAVWKAGGPQETVLLVFDVEDNKLLWSRNCGAVPAIDVSDDARLVGRLGGYNPVKRVAGTLSVFNLASGQPTWSGKLLRDWFDLSPDGQKAVADGFIFDSASIIDRHARGPVTAKRPRGSDVSRFSPDNRYVAINLLDPRNDLTIVESATGKRVELPLEELPFPDRVFGETSGIETFMNQKQWARSLWRRSPAGTALYDAAWQDLSQADRKRVEDGRVRFR